MEKLRKLTQTLLAEVEDFAALRESTQELHTLFAQETGIRAGDLTHAQMQSTANGKIVHELHAAHCVLDILRTRQFLRAIHKAINHYLAQVNCIHLLYAGTGPFATLLTPLLPLFRPDQLRLTMLEINPTSMQALKKLYKSWGLEPFVAQYLLRDATDTSLSFSQEFHLIVSETMQAGLRAECQVPLTRNLVRFLHPEGTFIPQRIELDAYLVGKQDVLDPNKTEKQCLGSAYQLDFRKVPEPNATQTLPVPATDFRLLQLFITIHLFEDIRLLPFQSGLTIPLTLTQFGRALPDSLHFQYSEGENPELRLRS